MTEARKAQRLATADKRIAKLSDQILKAAEQEEDARSKHGSLNRRLDREQRERDHLADAPTSDDEDDDEDDEEEGASTTF